MRVNVYAEELTDKVETFVKGGFVGVRFYLELPVTQKTSGGGNLVHKGPFMHKPGDDDSSAVTFFAKRAEELVELLQNAIDMLEEEL